jgi:hypothetical protein
MPDSISKEEIKNYETENEDQQIVTKFCISTETIYLTQNLK